MPSKSFWLLLLALKCTLSYKLLRFGGAGINYWWQAGAATFLQEKFDLSSIDLVGASAGAITAAMLVGNGSFEDGAELAIRQARDNDLWNKKTGLAGIWGTLVRSYLEELIQAENLSTENMQRVHIAVTPQLVLQGTRLVSNFSSKSDLLDAVMASVHIPLFMNGRWFSNYRGERYIDGSFWGFIAKQQVPLPRHLQNAATFVSSEDILDINYQLDTRFVESQDRRNMVRLITPEGLYDMMHFGYEYMRKQERMGHLQDLDNIPSKKNYKALRSDNDRLSAKQTTIDCT